ncbi:MAG: hypothetical protein ACKVK0_06450 [Pirellulales bacterium]|jgi:hypothetical protein
MLVIPITSTIPPAFLHIPCHPQCRTGKDSIPPTTTMLQRDEYIEQAYFFQILGERLLQDIPIQDILEQVRDETLATTKLPIALDYMLAELCSTGVVSPAMEQLAHYFTPFQTHLIREAERDDGKFDLRAAVTILQSEAEYRADEPSRAGLFLYQLESICHNNLPYDSGLCAMSEDAFYDEHWQQWILVVRRQIGIIEIADLIFSRSGHYINLRNRHQTQSASPEQTVLFGEKEGRIALANSGKDPLFLFASLQRHLGYPQVPRPKPIDETKNVIAVLQQKLDQLSIRTKFLEDENRGGIDLTQYYKKP